MKKEKKHVETIKKPETNIVSKNQNQVNHYTYDEKEEQAIILIKAFVRS